MVGDPQQLPVTTLSKHSVGLQRSLFERLKHCGWPMNSLRYQYRMHPEIMQFPSENFYDNKLLSGKFKDQRHQRQLEIRKDSSLFRPYMVWHCPGPMKCSSGSSYSNEGEVKFIQKYLKDFNAHCASSKNIVEIGIITFYRGQVSVKKLLIIPVLLSRRLLIPYKIYSIFFNI